MFNFFLVRNLMGFFGQRCLTFDMNRIKLSWPLFLFLLKNIRRYNHVTNIFLEKNYSIVLKKFPFS